MRTVRILGFRGMNNVSRRPGLLTDRDGLASPSMVFDSYASSDRVLVKRNGVTKVIALAGAHSLWAGESAFCVAQGTLYRIKNQTVAEICSVGDSPMSYAEVGQNVYMANGQWKGVYDTVADAMGSWGLDLPPAPKIDVISGQLPPGTYHLCYTYLTDGHMSGNGAIVRVVFEGNGGGISLVGQPPDTLLWITEPNQKNFFLAPETPVLTPVFGMPLPTYRIIPPPAMSGLLLAFGRIWGISGTKVVYSQPYSYDWFKENNSFDFSVQVLDMARGVDRLYVRTVLETLVLRGTDPEKMELAKLSGGGVPGKAFYAQIVQQGVTTIVPVWMNLDGLVIALPDGNALNVSSERLKISSASSWAGLARTINGERMLVVTVAKTIADEITDIVSRGKIFTTGPLGIVGSGGVSIN